MIFAAYMPSWEGAARALPGQCLLVGALAGALFFYARQRHGTPRSAVALVVGLVVGLVIGLGWALRDWALDEGTPGFSRGLLFEWDIITFFELGRSAVAAALGLLVGWLSLECHGWFRRRSAVGEQSRT